MGWGGSNSRKQPCPPLWGLEAGLGLGHLHHLCWEEGTGAEAQAERLYYI